MTQVLQSGVLLGNNANFSTSLWSVAAGLNKVHGLWKIYIKGTTYLNPDNFLECSSGAIYRALIGSKFEFKILTVPFFITSKFLDLFEQEDAWSQEYAQWVESIKCIQPVHAKITQDISRYKISWLHYETRRLLLRIQRIAFCSLQLAWQSFRLIMRIMDIVDLITVDPAKLNELLDQSVLESGLNIPRCMNTLIKNKSFFIKRLEKKEAGMDQALRLLGCQKLKAAEIIDTAKRFFEQSEKGFEYYDKARRKAGSVVKQLGKKIIYDWSPDALKKILKERQLDPYSEQENLSLKSKPRRVLRAPKPLLCYDRNRQQEGEKFMPAKNAEIQNLPLNKQNIFGCASKAVIKKPKKVLKAC